MSDERIPSELPWYLAEVIEVEKEKAVQCQCKDCGRRVHKAVHMIVWEDDRIECWGSTCFSRELSGLAPEDQQAARYARGSGGGRRLTDEERALLDGNRMELIARFRTQWEHWKEETRRKAAEEEARAAAVRRRTEARNAARVAAEAAWQAEHEKRVERQARLDAFMANAKKNRQPRLESRVQVNRGTPSPPAIREPNDPRYFEIKKNLETAWLNSGQSLEGAYQQRTLVENAIAKYLRRYPNARW